MFHFFKKYPALLSFGMLTALFSSPGQTFLVSLFIPGMRETFAFGHTEMAAYYSVVTLLSALVLPWSGKLFDRSDVRIFGLIAGGLLALGCFLLSMTSWVPFFFMGLFLVRNLGQGTMPMIGSTTMARFFGASRGKALGISNLGYPLGEALFPVLVSPWILNYGWRAGWNLLGWIVVVVLIPGIYFLMRDKPHHQVSDQGSHVGNQSSKSTVKDWALGDVLKDSLFYFLLIPILIPPFIFTAIFFHHGSFFEWKGWGLSLIAGGFVSFGLFRALFSFLIGPLIDRYTAKKLFPFKLIPLALGLLCFWFGEHKFIVFIYLGFCGMTMGLSMTLSGALFAEVYGVRELGAIRGVKSAILVFSTAIAPVLLGAGLDAGYDLGNLLIFSMVLVVFGILLSCMTCWRPDFRVSN